MRATEFVVESVLNELNMAPGNLAAFAASPAAANMQAGFEAELIFTKLYGGGGGENESEPDFDRDKPIKKWTTVTDIATFFEVSDKYDSSIQQIQQEYTEWMDNKYADWSEDKFQEYLAAAIEENPDLDPDDDMQELSEKAYDAMLDEFYDTNPIDVGEFLLDTDCNSFVDVMRKYDFVWPYETAAGGWAESANEIKEAIEAVTSKDAIVSGSYHTTEKDGTSYYIEPDGSIEPGDDQTLYFTAEVVSPPMPAMQMLNEMETVLTMLMQQFGADTNKTTGLHVGVSIAGLKTHEVDYVKLALFLGDNYVLQQFGRAANTYAKSSLNYLAQRGPDLAGFSPEIAQKMRQGLMTQAANIVAIKNNERYFTINYHGDYIEFRSMGGDYLSMLPQVKNTILRYIRAYAVAADPNAEKQEYAKKFAKLINPGNNDDLNVFVNYMTQQRNIPTASPAAFDARYQPIKQNLKATLANRQGKVPGAPQLARSPAPKLPDRVLPVKPQPTTPPLPDIEI